MDGYQYHAEIQLYCPGSFSLKDKRRLIHGLVTRLRQQFNLAVAEVGDQDHHRLVTLSLASVSSSIKQLQGLKTRLLAECDEVTGVQIREYNEEIL